MEKDLATLLKEEPYRFEFFHAVRMLQFVSPNRFPIGKDAPASDEIVRFCGYQSLSFPPSEVMGLDYNQESDAPPEMTVAFMGLTGASGALPRFYTEMILDRKRHKDTALREFLDLFNHRLVSLFFRAWEKYHYCFTFELAERQARRLRRSDRRAYKAFVERERKSHDIFSQILLDYSGMGAGSLRYHRRLEDPHRHDSQPVAQQRELGARTVISDHTWRFYSGVLSRRQPTAIGLSRLLEGYFGRRVRVREMVGQWVQVDEEYQSRVGVMNGRLGVDTMVGERVWDCQGKFRIRIGPVNYNEFREFQPTGTSLRAMAQLTRRMVGHHLEFDVQVVLRKEEIPECQLGGLGGTQLGWNTWLKSKPAQKNAEDAVFFVSDEVSTGGLGE